MSKTNDSWDRLIAETLRTAVRVCGRHATLQRQAAREPRAGDLYFFPVAGDYVFEWAAIDCHNRSWRLIAVDDNPLVGSRDVGLAEHAPGGPTTLRCDCVLRCDEGDLVAEYRSGVLKPGVLSQARSKLREVETRQVEATLLEQEVDASPEYAAWKRRLDEALTETSEAVTPDAAEWSVEEILNKVRAALTQITPSLAPVSFETRQETYDRRVEIEGPSGIFIERLDEDLVIRIAVPRALAGFRVRFSVADWQDRKILEAAGDQAGAESRILQQDREKFPQNASLRVEILESGRS